MFKSKVYISLLLSLLLVGCHQQDTDMKVEDITPLIQITTATQDTTEDIRIKEQELLLETNNKDIISIVGKRVLSGKKVEKTVRISSKKKARISISRDHPNGMQIMLHLDNYCFDLMNSVDEMEDVYLCIIDDFGCALPDYRYEIAFYDFNEDGNKELIFNAGNKKDRLQIYIFGVDYNADSYLEQQPRLISSFKGTTKAYINDKNEICVITDDQNNIEVYKYDGTKVE